MLSLSLFRGAWSLIDLTLHGLTRQGVENLEIVWVCEPRWVGALEHRLASSAGKSAKLTIRVISLTPDAADGWMLDTGLLPEKELLAFVTQGDEFVPNWLSQAREELHAHSFPTLCGGSQTLLHKAQSHGAWTCVGTLTLPQLPDPWSSPQALLQAPPSLSGIVAKRDFVLNDPGTRWLLEHPFLWEILPLALAAKGPLPTPAELFAVLRFHPDILPGDSIFQRERSLKATLPVLLARPEWLGLAQSGWPESLRPVLECPLGPSLSFEAKTKTLLEKSQLKASPSPTSKESAETKRSLFEFAKKKPETATPSPIGQWPRPGALKPQAMDPAALEKFIAKAGQLTLDVFDTCIHRAIGRPADAFLLLAHHLKSSGISCQDPLTFREARLTAERLAWQAFNQENELKCDVPLDHIYQRLQSRLGWNDAETTRAKALEIEVESSLLYANPLMQKLVTEAVSRKQPLRYLSDMYFPSSVIASWLKENQFPNAEVTVSCEEGCSKSSGPLYARVLQAQGWAAKSTHHIGDNADADVASAQRNGLAAFRFRDRKEDHPFFDQVVAPFDWQNDLTTSLTIGMARKFRRTQDSAKAETTPGLAAQIGYEIVGPLLFGYALWLRNQARSQKLDALFFLARDGYWLDKIFTLLDEKWSPVCKHAYIALSRESVMLAARPKDKAQWLETCLATEPNLNAEVVLRRAGLADSTAAKAAVREAFQQDNPVLVAADSRWISDKGRSLMQKVLEANQPAAARKQEETRGLLNDYLKQQSYDANHSALVDLGWAGTIPKLLSAALPAEETPRIFFFGAYLNKAQAHRQGFSLNAWYFNEPGVPLPPSENETPVRSQIINPVRNLVEMMVSGTEGKSTGFQRAADGTVSPTQDPPDTDGETSQFLSILHAAALQFAGDLLVHLKEESWAEEARLDAYLDTVMYRLLWIPKPREAKILGSIKFQSTAFGCLASIPSVVLPDKNSGPRSAEVLRDSFERSAWKRGWLTQLTREEMETLREGVNR